MSNGDYNPDVHYGILTIQICHSYLKKDFAYKLAFTDRTNLFDKAVIASMVTRKLDQLTLRGSYSLINVFE